MLNKYDFLRMMQRNFPDGKPAQGDKWFVMRCRYCGKPMHMGVRVPQNSELSYFNCFKCHTSGSFTPSIMIKWGSTEIDDINMLKDYCKSVGNLPVNKKYKDHTYLLVNDYIQEGNLTNYKLKRINDRLGVNLTLEDCKKLKICLNLSNVLQRNAIKDFTRDSNIVSQLDKYFLGFISQDNAFINMRRLCNEGKVFPGIDNRYINYNLFNKFDNTLRYYTIPTQVNPEIPRRIRLNIAEGPFDILSIYLNVVKDHDNSIFTSILGSSYDQIIKFFILDMKLAYLDIHIYKDKDIPDSKFRDIAEYLRLLNIPLTMHINRKQGEKDFGVSPDRIVDFQYKL